MVDLQPSQAYHFLHFYRVLECAPEGYHFPKTGASDLLNFLPLTHTEFPFYFKNSLFNTTSAFSCKCSWVAYQFLRVFPSERTHKKFEKSPSTMPHTGISHKRFIVSITWVTSQGSPPEKGAVCCLLQNSFIICKRKFFLLVASWVGMGLTSMFYGKLRGFASESKLRSPISKMDSNLKW